MATATKRQAASTEERDDPQRQFTRSSSTTTRREQDSPSTVRTNGCPQDNVKNITAEQLAHGLGWFSIGLGLSEVLAPRGIAKVCGVRGDKRLIRLFGVREILSGIGIFAQGRRPAAAVWSRVAGDALDLATLGAAFASPRSNKRRLAFATANVLAVTALDITCAQQLSRNGNTTLGGTSKVKKSLIIDRPPEELYQFWRNFENLPRFMRYLESVRVNDQARSHWVAKGPAETSVEWDAEVTEDRPNEMIAWRSLEGSDVDNSGSVWFEPAPGDRGTIVHVEIDYHPPGGVIGEWLAKLTGNDPGWQAQEALRSFKQLMETGEIIVSDGTIWDNGYLTQRPAQPVSSEEVSFSRGA